MSIYQLVFGTVMSRTEAYRVSDTNETVCIYVRDNNLLQNQNKKFSKGEKADFESRRSLKMLGQFSSIPRG